MVWLLSACVCGSEIGRKDDRGLGKAQSNHISVCNNVYRDLIINSYPAALFARFPVRNFRLTSVVAKILPACSLRSAAAQPQTARQQDAV